MGNYRGGRTYQEIVDEANAEQRSRELIGKAQTDRETQQRSVRVVQHEQARVQGAAAEQGRRNAMRAAVRREQGGIEM